MSAVVPEPATMPAPSILIVEDERIVALHLHDQLVRLGYAVRGMSASASDALDLYAATDPDIVLMDIRLDGEIDGIDAAARMNEIGRAAVVYLTASAEDETIARARRTNPFGYLIKPFSERELHATLQIALQRRIDDRALRASENRLRLALDAARMGSWELDPVGGHLHWDRQTGLIVGCGDPPSRHRSRSLAKRHVHPEDIAAVESTLATIRDGGALGQVEFRGAPAEGEERWYRIQAKRFDGLGSNARRIVGVVQDITSARADEVRLREAASVFEAAHEGILLLDHELRVTAANPGYCTITGLAEHEIVGRRPPLLDIDGASATAAARDAIGSLLAADGWRGELTGRHRDGKALIMRVDLVAVRNPSGELMHNVAVLSDITALRTAEDELRHRAHHDSLTGLANRFLGRDRLHHGLERCRRHGGRIALLMIDIDHFKRINDTYGHAAGDELLQAVAQRLLERTRAEDTVARLGGDEFMIVLEKIRQDTELGTFTRQIVELVARPLTIGGVTVNVSTSIGISVFPDDADNVEDLIRAADTALYVTKERDRNGFTFHSPDMRDRMGHQVLAELDLRRGMADGELLLHFQPLVSLASGRIVAAEALLRRRTRDGRLHGAETIVPVAERGELIVEIGEWVIHEACRQALVWQSAGASRIRLSINVSVQQLTHDSLARTFDTLRGMPNVDADLIELEITEDSLQTEERALQAVRELEAMGIGFAIDDFGTGYSNLHSLKHLPLRRLKIDRSLVQDLPGDTDDVAIIEAIIAMGHRLGLQLVAEGVERREQHDFLAARGCEEAQGYYYARPLSAEAFLERLLRDDR